MTLTTYNTSNSRAFSKRFPLVAKGTTVPMREFEKVLDVRIVEFCRCFDWYRVLQIEARVEDLYAEYVPHRLNVCGLSYAGRSSLCLSAYFEPDTVEVLVFIFRRTQKDPHAQL